MKNEKELEEIVSTCLKNIGGLFKGLIDEFKSGESSYKMDPDEIFSDYLSKIESAGATYSNFTVNFISEHLNEILANYTRSKRNEILEQIKVDVVDVLEIMGEELIDYKLFEDLLRDIKKA